MGAERGARDRKSRTAKRRDHELVAGSSAHYEDPAYYTKTYRNRLEDVRYYVELASEHRGPVLEYGCGNGRITIPLARSAARVTGIDISPAMLADLRRRLADEEPGIADRVTLRRGDMRTCSVGRRFPLVICPFNAFLHLYTRRDVEAFLARVRAHLAPGGRFVFDISVPQPAELARDPNRAFFAPRFRYPAPNGSSDEGGRMVRYSEHFDYDGSRQILFVSMQFHPVAGGDSWMTPLAHRQFFPQEIEALLHYNGFSIRSLYGDFFEGPMTRDSHTMLLHCKATARSPA